MHSLYPEPCNYHLIICYFGYMIGFFKPAYISITANLPVGYWYLTTLSWTNIFIPVIAFAVAFACYWPFFQVYEKRLVAKEAQARKKNNGRKAENISTGISMGRCRDGSQSGRRCLAGGRERRFCSGSHYCGDKNVPAAVPEQIRPQENYQVLAIDFYHRYERTLLFCGNGI